MAYTKTPKMTQDAPVGVGYLNRLLASYDTIQAQLDVEHGFDEGAQPGSGGLAGEHSGPKFVSASVSVSCLTLGGQTIVLRPGDDTPGITASRLSAGVYEVSGLQFSLLDGNATPASTSTNPRFCACEQSNISGAPASIRISCYEIASGSFALTDFPFHLAIYGR